MTSIFLARIVFLFTEHVIQVKEIWEGMVSNSPVFLGGVGEVSKSVSLFVIAGKFPKIHKIA